MHRLYLATKAENRKKKATPKASSSRATAQPDPRPTRRLNSSSKSFAAPGVQRGVFLGKVIGIATTPQIDRPIPTTSM